MPASATSAVTSTLTQVLPENGPERGPAVASGAGAFEYVVVSSDHVPVETRRTSKPAVLLLFA